MRHVPDFSRRWRRLLESACAAVALSLAGNAVHALDVGQWKRFEVAYANTSWSGNPFDLDFQGVFTSPSGTRVMTQPGFYAGNNIWKIYFMPDEPGTWTFRTVSPDADLNDRTGSFACLSSGLASSLTPRGTRWQLGNGAFDLPLIWSLTVPNGDGTLNDWGAMRAMSASDPVFAEAVAEAVQAGARLARIGAIVTPGSRFQQDARAYVAGQEGVTFYLPFWDRMNDKLDLLRDNGIGLYAMFYVDKTWTPDLWGIAPQSAAEQRLFRYAVARFACYPHVMWDSGIDISEYRSNSWIDWFADWMLANDPWQHPVDSRSGGGSGGKHAVNANYWSDGATGDGASDIPGRATLLSNFNNRNVPTAYTDAWRPFSSRGNWDNDAVRRVMWRLGLTGGQGTIIDYLDGLATGVQKSSVQATIDTGVTYLGNAIRFFRQELRSSYGQLDPRDDLLTGGSNIILAANPGLEYVAYDRDGGTIGIDLTAASGVFVAEWYDPRTGAISGGTTVDGGAARTFNSPTSGSNADWVLHLFRSGGGTPPPTPTGLTVR